MKSKTVSRIKQIKNQNIAAIMSKAVVLVGALGVGVGLLLSEILYPQIEELFACPAWYQAFLYISFAVAIAGLVWCWFTKNRKNTPKIEWQIELGLFIFGFVLEIICALARTESYTKDVFICIGGAISSVGLFCGIGSMLGRLKKPTNTYADIYSNLVTNGNLYYNNFPKTKPASLAEVTEVEEYLGAPLPAELVDFLLEFNGDGNLLFSTKDIISTTKSLRESLNGPAIEGADKFCFIGSDSSGEGANLFCYKITDEGSIQAVKIFLWNRETNDVKPVASTLPELINQLYNNDIE